MADFYHCLATSNTTSTTIEKQKHIVQGMVCIAKSSLVRVVSVRATSARLAATSFVATHAHWSVLWTWALEKQRTQTTYIGDVTDAFVIVSIHMFADVLAYATI